MPIIDNAVYVHGERTANPPSLEETFETLHDRKGIAWIGMYRPNRDELQAVADEFGLHPLAVEDALKGHQRAKLEKFGDVLFLVLRPARYLDAEERVEFGEVHVFMGPDFAITIRHAEAPDLGRVRKRLEQNPELLALGTEAILYAVLDEVVDGYAPVIAGLQNDIDEIEDQLFGGVPEVSKRIYELEREVMAFQRAATPLVDILQSLERGFEKYNVHVELRRSLRDVLDHGIRTADRVEGFRTLLQNLLTTSATLVTEKQNDEMRRLTETSITQGEQVKRISSWAAILFAPSLITGIYGMNFRFMPELDWVLGYPLALLLMAILSGGLYRAFKKRGWL
jgi:magnesium transporter